MKGSCLLELFGFNFPPAAIRELINAADLHHDGVIEYDEFVPVATKILNASPQSSVLSRAEFKRLWSSLQCAESMQGAADHH